jgi:hypothetical protein
MRTVYQQLERQQIEGEGSQIDQRIARGAGQIGFAGRESKACVEKVSDRAANDEGRRKRDQILHVRVFVQTYQQAQAQGKTHETYRAVTGKLMYAVDHGYCRPRVRQHASRVMPDRL